MNRIDKADLARRPVLALAGCVMLSALLCVGQIRAATGLIAATLFAFLLFLLWASSENNVFAVLLYFLPWSPLLKLYYGGFSFFTVGLLLTCGISFLRDKGRIRVYQVVLTCVVMALTLVGKAVQGNRLAFSYAFFLAMLLLFPCVTKGSDQRLDLWLLTAFFACGIITAALSAQQIARYPNISRFIKVDSYLTITRLSGYYGDPNFYSAHITACLAGIQILLSRERQRLRQLLLAMLAVLLLYCGLLSASKTFVVVTALLFFIWVPILLERHSFGTGRLRLILGILCAGLLVFTSTAFQELMRIMDTRFSYASNVSELTTGRTDLWVNYLKEFSSNIPLTLLGEGYSAVTLHGRASHNTLIQGVYQFGILGFPLVIAWLFITLRGIYARTNLRQIRWNDLLLAAIGVALPWMGLDILFFDELFLLPVYAAIAAAYSASELKDG